MKRLFTALLAIMMVFTTTMTIAADGFVRHDLHDATLLEEPARAPVVKCPMCGGQMKQVTERSSYVLTEDGPCVHGKPFGYDSTYERQVYVYQRCGSCGYKKLLSEKIETKTECHGHH